MAGDWIKMRGNLWDDPRIARLCDLTGQTEAIVIGGLYWLWATADQHTEDGCMPGLSLNQIDRKTGIKGLGAALCAVDWLHDDPQGVVVVKFEEHNGASAKKRCQTAKRVAAFKAASPAVTLPEPTGNAPSVTKVADERDLEIEREIEKNKTTDAGASAGAAKPRPSRKCPATFEPEDPRSWIAAHTPGVDWQLETAKFRDHTFKNAISDWLGAWRNWMRRAAEDLGKGLSFRERDAQLATARIHEMTGGLVSAKPPVPVTRRNDALQEIFDAATPRRLG